MQIPNPQQHRHQYRRQSGDPGPVFIVEPGYVFQSTLALEQRKQTEEGQQA